MGLIFGNPITRPLLGGVIGGAIGGLTDDHSHISGTIGSIATGALAGAGIGAAFSSVGKGLLKAPFRVGHMARVLPRTGGMGTGLLSRIGFSAHAVGKSSFTKSVSETLGGIGSIGASLSSVAYSGGKAALRHPGAAIGIGLAGLGAYGLASSGYGSSNASSEAMSALAVRRGAPSTSSAALGLGSSYPNPLMMSQKYRTLMESAQGDLAFGLHQGRH